jgi:hypothetical protein
MIVPHKLNVKNMILICIQCVLNVYLKSCRAIEANTSQTLRRQWTIMEYLKTYQALEANTSQNSTRQWIILVVPDKLDVKR